MKELLKPLGLARMRILRQRILFRSGLAAFPLIERLVFFLPSLEVL